MFQQGGEKGNGPEKSPRGLGGLPPAGLGRRDFPGEFEFEKKVGFLLTRLRTERKIQKRITEESK